MTPRQQDALRKLTSHRTAASVVGVASSTYIESASSPAGLSVSSSTGLVTHDMLI